MLMIYDMKHILNGEYLWDYNVAKSLKLHIVVDVVKSLKLYVVVD